MNERVETNILTPSSVDVSHLWITLVGRVHLIFTNTFINIIMQDSAQYTSYIVEHAISQL